MSDWDRHQEYPSKIFGGSCPCTVRGPPTDLILLQGARSGNTVGSVTGTKVHWRIPPRTETVGNFQSTYHLWTKTYHRRFSRMGNWSVDFRRDRLSWKTLLYHLTRHRPNNSHHRCRRTPTIEEPYTDDVDSLTQKITNLIKFNFIGVDRPPMDNHVEIYSSWTTRTTFLVSS